MMEYILLLVNKYGIRTLPDDSQAGLCSSTLYGDLKPSRMYVPTRCSVDSPDKLTLALEPEAAAFYCRERTTNKGLRSDEYIVVDIGGGTVDIAAHRITGGHDDIEVLRSPAGNAWGGTKVNKEFEKFLESLVDDPGFKAFIQTRDMSTNAKNRAVLLSILQHQFETQKTEFGNKAKKEDSNAEACINLGSAFCSTYSERLTATIEKLNDPEITLEDQDLRLPYRKMQEFYKPVVNGILECLHKELDGLAGRVDTIYLVGGFGGSEYIRSRVKERFMINGRLKNLYIPAQPEYAIVYGAVLYCKSPERVRSRRADATYGTACSKPFDENNQYHLRKKPYFDINKDGKPKMTKLFLKIVEVGESLSADTVYNSTFSPYESDTTSATFRVFRSPRATVDYICDEFGKLTVEELGQVSIEMPDKEKGLDRPIEVTFDFTQTEIQVRVATTQKEVKAVIDFL